MKKKQRYFFAAAFALLALTAAAIVPAGAVRPVSASSQTTYEAAEIVDANDLTGPAYAAGAGIIYNAWETPAVGVAWMEQYTSTSVQHGVRFPLDEPLTLGAYATNGAIRFRLNFYTENNSGGGTGLGDVILHIQNGTEETLYRTSSSADFYRLADDLDRTNLLDAGIGGTRVYADGDDSWIYAKKRNSQFYSHAYYQEGSSETNQTVKGDPWQTDVYDGAYVVPLTAYEGLSSDSVLTAVSITNVSNYMYRYNYNIGRISMGTLSVDTTFGWTDETELFDPADGSFGKFTTGTAAADTEAMASYHAERVSAGSIKFSPDATGWDTLGVRLPDELVGPDGTADFTGIAGVLFDIAYEGTARPYFNWQLYNSSVPERVNSNNYRWQWLNAAEYYYKADGDITPSSGRNLEMTSFDGLLYYPFEADNFGDAGSSGGTNPLTEGETAKPFITLIFNGATNAGREFRLRGIRFVTDDSAFFDTAAVTVTAGQDFAGTASVTIAGTQTPLSSGGTAEGSIRFDDSISLTYAADEGYIAEIAVGGVPVTLTDPSSGTVVLEYGNAELLAMDLSVEITVAFTPLLRITSAVTGGGAVAADKTYYAVGDTAVLTLTPDAGWEIGTVDCGGSTYTLENGVLSFVMAADTTVSVQFTPVAYTITYELDGGVNAAENPPTYTVETAVTFAAPTKEGWAFAYWADENGSPVTGIAAGSLGDVTVRAVFTQLPASSPGDENTDDGLPPEQDDGCGCGGFAGGGGAAAIPALAAGAYLAARRKRRG